MRRLYSVRRFIRLDTIGEGIKGAKNVGAVIAAFATNSTRPRTETSMFDNEFIRAYLSIISGIFFVQTSLFLMLPLYVNYTVGGLGAMILIAMLSVILIIADAKLFKSTFCFAAGATAFIYSVGLIFCLFPQISFLTGMNTVNVISAEEAYLANKALQLPAKQQEEKNKEYLKKMIAWKEANPDTPYPQYFLDGVERARKEGIKIPKL
jgi:hypothetical protein